MFKIFLRMWQINWAEQWQYRANLMMYLLYELVSPVVFLSVWRAVAAGQHSVDGLTANDFTVYYLLLLLVNKLTGEITIHILAYKIHDGTLSSELLRPVHPILTSALVYNLAFKALTLIVLAPVWAVLCLVFRPDFSGVTAANLLLALPAIWLGFAINFLLGAIVTCVAFWTTRVYTLSEFIYGFVMLFGGTFVPLNLLPGFAQGLAQALPFQLYLYFPIQVILGRLSSSQLLLNFGLQAAWLFLLALAFAWLWRQGVQRFSAVGA
ncbi:MAG: ABC transporter permease [Chloroflexi bacterium]|jgi:ABC-2 type transport system permease protein|nr:ABC transporter permease [Chloroflexota bacterium]